MKRYALLLLIFLFILVGFTPPALALDARLLATACLEKSGIMQTIEGLGPLVEAQLERKRKNASDPARFNRVSATILRHFDTRRIREATLGRVHADLSSADLAELLNWLNTPLGNRFATAEANANAPEPEADYHDFVARIRSAPPSATRAAITRRIVADSMAVDLAVSLTLTLTERLAAPFIASFPETGKPGMSPLRTELSARKPALEAAFRTQAEHRTLFAYENFTEAELVRYHRHVKRQTTRAFARSVTEGLKTGLNAVFENIDAAMADPLATP